MELKKHSQLQCRGNFIMFFESASDIPEIAKKCGTAIFIMPHDIKVTIKNAIVLEPDEKSVITIEQIRKILQKLTTKQTSDIYVVVRPAEAMNLEAANAFLKALEEPGDKLHFVLVTDAPSMILPTILSRSSIYFMKTKFSNDVNADQKVKDLAKKLLVSKGVDLVAVADEISKKKDGVRMYAMEVLGVAIEMLYKSYFITGKEIFIKKIPGFLKAYEGISKNGHVKLQIVSNLC